MWVYFPRGTGLKVDISTTEKWNKMEGIETLLECEYYF